MNAKPSAIVADAILVVLLLGLALVVAGGLVTTTWNTDRPLLPLSVDGSRALLLLLPVSIVLGMILAFTLPRRATRAVGGELVRYAPYERLVHWALAVGFVLDFGTAAWLLRWFGLDPNITIRPTLYLLHFVGAGLIVLGATTFVTSSRVRGEDGLFPRWGDVSPAIARLFGYLGIYGESGVLGMRWPSSWQKGTQATLAAVGVRPAKREGKFLAVEKVLSFTPLAVLALIVIATGLVKSARYFFGVAPDVLYWSTWLHDLALWLTAGVVGVHVAAIALVPRNWSGIRAMLTGRTTVAHAEEEFPAWVDEVRRRGDLPAPTAGAAAHEASAD